MRQNPRHRRHLHPILLWLMHPLFRYSWGREAWVMRGIGEHHGPVLVKRDRSAD
jgi:hypothetical protein